MKKYLNVFMIALLVGVITSCSKTNNDWNREGLKGKVESYTQKYEGATEKFGEWVASSDYGNYVKVTFNETGNRVQTEEFDDNRLIDKSILKSEDGKIIEESKHYNDGELFEVIKSTYLPKDKVEKVGYYPDGRIASVKTEYYKNDRLAKVEERDIEDKSKIYFTTTYKYDKDKNVIKRENKHHEPKETYVYDYEYIEFDDIGNWTKRLEYPSDSRSAINTFITIREFTYF